MADQVVGGQGVTMELLAGVLAQFPDVDRIVRDQTKLSGVFDIDLKFSPAFPAAAFLTLRPPRTQRTTLDHQFSLMCWNSSNSSWNPLRGQWMSS